MDKTTSQKICQLVAGIVISDEVLDEKEEAFVDRMISAFGLGEGSRDVIFPLVDASEAAREIQGMTREVQAEAFRLLIEAAVADGEVVAEERAYLKAVGNAMGVGDAEIERRLAAELAR